MLPLLLLKGSLIGLSVSLPMGPTGMLCLRYSLIRGKAFGLACGLGIALAEATCGALTAIGLTTLTDFIETNQIWLQLIGSLFLLYFGIVTLKSERKEPLKENAKEVVEKGHFKVFFLTFIITITNPLTLLSFVAIFSALGTENFENDIGIGLLSFGVFLGSSSWWALVSSSSSYFANKIRSSSAKLINKIAGFLIIGFSLFTFISGLRLLAA